jgi:hypothetical protein
MSGKMWDYELLKITKHTFINKKFGRNVVK